MKFNVQILLICILLPFFSCRQNGSNLTTEIEKLESQIEVLNAQIEEKNEIIAVAFHTIDDPILNEFFKEAMGQAPVLDPSRKCYIDCGKALEIRNNACDELPTILEKCDCREEASRRFTSCQGNCNLQHDIR